MKQRLHAVVTDAWHLVLLVVAAGLAVGATAALGGYVKGYRGGDLVLTIVIVVGVVGVLCTVVAAAIDPAGVRSDRGIYDPGEIVSQGQLMEAMEHGEAGLSDEAKKVFRQDDILMVGGVLLIGLAVLLGYICAWAGVPPTNPFH